MQIAVLESDALRKAFATDRPYAIRTASTSTDRRRSSEGCSPRHGVSVIFDATANKRAYRDRASQEIPRFLEVYVDTPLEVCMQRDPKGIYAKARRGKRQMFRAFRRSTRRR